MIVEWGNQMGVNWERLTIAILAAALLGIVYAVLVHWVYTRDPDHPYTFVAVVLGTLLTLLLAWIVVPGIWLIVITALFGITGLPQVIGAMVREAQQRRRAAAAERRAIADTLRPHGES